MREGEDIGCNCELGLGLIGKNEVRSGGGGGEGDAFRRIRFGLGVACDDSEGRLG